MPTIANTAQALALILNAREQAALAALAEIGAVLLDPRAIDMYLPPVARADISFDADRGGGEVTETTFFGQDDQPLPCADCAILLDVCIPDGPGPDMPLDEFIEDTVLELLELRHPGWKDDVGSAGTVELRWQRRDDGSVKTEVGGTIGYRHIETTDEPFWSDDDSDG